MRKTKIVCTLGPATDNEDVLRKLMLAGMNVARLNFSHGTHEEQKKRMDMVKKLRAELDFQSQFCSTQKDLRFVPAILRVERQSLRRVISSH